MESLFNVTAPANTLPVGAHFVYDGDITGVVTAPGAADLYYSGYRFARWCNVGDDPVEVL